MILTEETTRSTTKNTLIWISYLLTVTKRLEPKEFDKSGHIPTDDDDDNDENDD